MNAEEKEVLAAVKGQMLALVAATVPEASASIHRDLGKQGVWAGAAAGAASGFHIGAGIGLATGGTAIAATIPATIIGFVVGALGGHQVGRKIDPDAGKEGTPIRPIQAGGGGSGLIRGGGSS